MVVSYMTSTSINMNHKSQSMSKILLAEVDLTVITIIIITMAKTLDFKLQTIKTSPKTTPIPIKRPPNIPTTTTSPHPSIITINSPLIHQKISSLMMILKSTTLISTLTYLPIFKNFRNELI